MNSEIKRSFLTDSWIYFCRINQFTKKDWLVYIAWVGLMCGLLASVSIFFYMGHSNGVEFPSYTWNIPIGTFIFVIAIAFDTIGHRTVYKTAIEKGENLVHHITIFAGITSVIALCLAYEHPGFMKFPVIVMIFLSIVYSLIDEGLHWHRYLNLNSDRVEMWSHFFILTGHLLMILPWWVWYSEGYPGVRETLVFFK